MMPLTIIRTRNTIKIVCPFVVKCLLSWTTNNTIHDMTFSSKKNKKRKYQHNFIKQHISLSHNFSCKYYSALCSLKDICISFSISELFSINIASEWAWLIQIQQVFRRRRRKKLTTHKWRKTIFHCLSKREFLRKTTRRGSPSFSYSLSSSRSSGGGSPLYLQPVAWSPS